MYGQSVGKLRIYQKPLSLDFKDVLINDDSEDDEDNEDKSKYLIFSISGTQGNAWIKGGAFMRVLNENFEIVIEAVTGHTMMCDIAIDDVSILLDDDCIDEDQATTPQMIEEDDNIFDVQSCVGRCLKDNVTKIKVVNATLLCNCNFDCLTDLTCCPDFIDVCSELEPSTVATTSTTTTTPKIIVATTSTTTAKPTPKPTPKTTVASTIITTSTTPKTTPKTTVASTITTTSTTLKTTLKTTPKKTVATTTKTIVTEKKTTDFTTLDPYRFITDKNSDVDEFIVDHDDDEEYDDSIETIKPQEIAKKSSSSSSSVSSSSSTSTLKTTTFSHSITLILISLGFVLTITVIAFVLIKRYKSSTNPLNYKQNRRKVNTKNVTEEFSEVRYLTEDECLDFNLATTESCE